MEFTSQICTTKDQSERLLVLGLKKETADMTYLNDKICAASYNEMECPYDNLVKPAWSLYRLLYLLPEKTPYGDGYLTVEIINENVYIVLVIENIEQRVLKYTKGNLYNNLISCIEFYIKEGYFNKEYLND